jgi:hypothetical protein
MKIKLRSAQGRELNVEVVSMKDIAADGGPLVAMPYESSHFDYLEHIPGTTHGFPCSLCNADCVLAPSGQMQYALGKNPLLCIDCALALIGKTES